MPSGVKTVLGETGTSISGGQKTRIALARAVYSEADIYLLDDPRSSLDARVGRAVLDNFVKTALRGKIRSTLDASACFSDDELWAALDAVGMKPYVSRMPQKLDTMIENGGSNMSLGQRQLLFFARILLSRTKIILMDEATSSVDPETESCLRRVIQEKFSKTTLLAVLHRLQKSVLDDFDKVLVMDAGCIVEYDAPRVLLQNKESIFASLFLAHMSD
ncbi:P-loop containing nucleoside triphosphate hydrolase protein [Chytriomyces cf. hyalinus JEL632]|nr:P-loop containing nucleoside triphosphate hydrolase protein [Chytriomyces cf. hyalinus JEL632]